MKIARVFPRRTGATPTDDLAFIGDPPMFRPDVDEVHVSCTFTWDVAEAERLAIAWGRYYPTVKLGGPAISPPNGGFVPGHYLGDGYVITSYGCPNHCGPCLVPQREGRLRELPIRDGWNVVDNNLLACSRPHIEAVLDMLARQPISVRFTGGLQASLIEPWFVGRLKGLRIDTIYTAYDCPSEWAHVERAVKMIQDAFGWPAGTSRRKLACYILVAYGTDTPEAAVERLQRIGELDVAPFPMFYRPPTPHRRPVPRDWHDVMGRAITQPWASRMWARRCAVERQEDTPLFRETP